MAETVLYLCARNDRNGNPRRGWLHTYETGWEFFYDHGKELSPYWASMADGALRVNVTVKEFRRLVHGVNS